MTKNLPKAAKTANSLSRGDLRRPRAYSCAGCGHTVVVNVDAKVWCLRCGRRMAQDGVNQ